MSAAARLLALPVRGWQLARAGRPSPCRFTPTCSAYALDALEHHGALRGAALTVRRLLRCRPFGPFGYDPVPEPRVHEHHAHEHHAHEHQVRQAI